MDLRNRLLRIADQTETSPEYITKLYALEGLVRRAFLLPDAQTMIVRGSFITRAWVMPVFRSVQDLDFMADFPYDAERGEEYVRNFLKINDLNDGLFFSENDLEIQLTWQETDLPGQKFTIPTEFLGEVHLLSLDISYNDPLIPAPIWWNYPALLPELNMQVHTIVPELALAWKVHGLFEFWTSKGGAWRIKDLYDIYLLIKTQKIDENVFERAFVNAFEVRKTPFLVYQRVLDGQFGQSKGTQKAWEKFVEKLGGKVLIHNHLEMIVEIRKFLDKFFLKFGFNT